MAKTKIMEDNKMDFQKAFLSGNISEIQKRMLQLNYNAIGHTITSKYMALQLGYQHYGPANLHYGKLAGKIGKILNIPKMPKEKIGLLVSFKNLNNEWHWILRPEIRKALEELKWVEEKEFIHLEETEVPALQEGAVKTVSVNRYERNPAARKICLDKFGSKCKICKVDLGEIYGAVGRGYIHVHHIKQLSEIGQTYEIDPIKDLIPVCPNCHSMLHQKNPAYTPEELKSWMNSIM